MSPQKTAMSNFIAVKTTSLIWKIIVDKAYRLNTFIKIDFLKMNAYEYIIFDLLYISVKG
jgi:hypothetical protein